MPVTSRLFIEASGVSNRPAETFPFAEITAAETSEVCTLLPVISVLDSSFPTTMFVSASIPLTAVMRSSAVSVFKCVLPLLVRLAVAVILPDVTLADISALYFAISCCIVSICELSTLTSLVSASSFFSSDLILA